MVEDGCSIPEAEAVRIALALAELAGRLAEQK
jgi:hypothetical protein